MHIDRVKGIFGTSAVPEVVVGGGVVLAQPLQDELVVHEALDGLEQEGVEGQVADLLQLELLVDRLQLLQPLGGLLQLRQHLVVLLQEAGELLKKTKKTKTTHPAPSQTLVPQTGSKEPRERLESRVTLREVMFLSITSPIRW